MAIGNIKSVVKESFIVGFKRQLYIFGMLNLAATFTWAQDVSHLLNFTSKDNGNSEVYYTFSVKLAEHRVNTKDEGFKLSDGYNFSLGVGLQVVRFLSLEAEANVWYPKIDDKNEFMFAGTSLGSNVILNLPNKGPYAKFGFHCWGGTAFDTLGGWDEIGCSSAVGGGILLGEFNRGTFLELNHIRYKQIESWFLAAGVRF